MKNCTKCQLAIDDGVTRCPRCSAVLEDRVAPLLVDGRYAVESEIGHGAMGLVYLARDTGLDRLVALKFIAPRFVRDARAVERFRREAAALAVIRNEHVVQVHAFGRHDESCFFAMEYVRGESLETIIASHAKHGTYVPITLSLSILARVARGLGAVHDAGLLHRDVKPGNIVIEDRTGRPVVLDFGLVTPLTSEDPRKTDVVGSPPYMAPEQILPAGSADGLTPAADVYSLGCTAFELITGKLPFEGHSIYETMHLHLTSEAPRISSIRMELQDLDYIFSKAMAKQPGDRFPSATAFAAEIDRALARRGSGPKRAALAATMPATPIDAAVRILIVDDDPLIRRSLARVAEKALPDARLDIVHANSGLEALKRVSEAPPTLIIIDFDMPGMNGVETLALLRNQAGAERVPAIVMTGHDAESVRWRFSILGVKEYLVKPMDNEAMAAAIRRSVR